MDEVTRILYDNGLIKYKKLFSLFSKFAHADTKVKAGTYSLNTNYDYRAIVNGMSSSGKRVETEVTIPEGYTIDRLVTLLENAEVCSADDMWEALQADYSYRFLLGLRKDDKYRLEGYLFPDTYKFYVNDNAQNVVKKLLNNYSNKWTEEFDEKAAELGYSQRQIIIIASLIEREAGNDAERAAIASVIYNRLEHPEADTVGLLQIDASIVYAMARDGVTGDIKTDYDSPYNTYLHKGLPPGPISNPGLASIKAALEPEDTDYYYYALAKDGTHRFFKDYGSFRAFLDSDDFAGH